MRTIYVICTDPENGLWTAFIGESAIISATGESPSSAVGNLIFKGLPNLCVMEVESKR